MQPTQPPRPRSEQLHTPAWRRHRGLLVALLVALVLRVLLWDHIPRTGLISDEGEYLAVANWLAHGRGFAWYLGYLWTRAPLYPLFVAAHFWLFGDTLGPIYSSQILLSLLDVALVYFLAERLVGANDRRVSPFSILNTQFSTATLAALLTAIYFPFALYTQVLLSETLFITLLLGAFLALAIWAEEAGDRRQETGDRRQEIGWRAKDREPRTQNSELRTLNSKLRTGKLWAFIMHHSWLLVAGALFGLATLTRSLTLLFIPIVALWVLVRTKNGNLQGQSRTKNREQRTRSAIIRHAILCSFLFVLCSLLVILPWTIYNSARLYGGLVLVDTSGAFNILLGARTAYDGRRDDAATRDFVLALLDQQLKPEQRQKKLDDLYGSNNTLLRAGSCLYKQNDPALLAAIGRPVATTTQAERQQLMTREGICLIRATPVAFIQKSLAELIDLFQINYGGDERFADGFTIGRLPRWYASALFLLDDTIYVVVLPLAVIGWALTRKLQIANCRLQIGQAQRRQSTIYNLQSAIGLWWLYNLAVAPLLFAINRFRLPLLPFGFIFAAYALASLPQGWRVLRTRYGGLCAVLAALLFLIAATPYAYLEPRAPGADSQWASYLGPYPSSIDDTWRAWWARPGYLREQQVMQALGRGDIPTTKTLLEQPDLTSHTLALAQPLFAGLDDQPDQGLKLLRQKQRVLSPLEIALVEADLLRSKGERDAARAIFTQELVDNNNPVEWAWNWLHPAPLPDNRIDLAGNLDLGYIAGCYLGEGDPQANGNFRWCTDGARLRFPSAGSGAPQALVLRADGRGWAGYAMAPPPVQVFVGDQLAGTLTPNMHEPREFTIALPASPKGADVIVTFHGDTFIPGPDRYLRQQGKGVVGQVQRLCVRLDWAAIQN